MRRAAIRPSFLSLLPEEKITMLKFYDIDPLYTNYLRQFDNRIPHIVYGSNNKFVCGIVIAINNHNFFAPISSNKTKQQTNLLIKDDKGTVLSSIKFSFMFPAPSTTVHYKNFKSIRKNDPDYADLLEKEYEFVLKHESLIRKKAAKVYQIGKDTNHTLHKYCCDFPLLESKCDEWLHSKKGFLPS